MRFSQDYFEHTMDMEFLREYGYPFLKPQAEFYADYIVLNKNGGETAPFFAFETLAKTGSGQNRIKVYH